VFLLVSHKVYCSGPIIVFGVLYINDLPLCAHNTLRLYADDVLLYSYISSKEECLKKDLDALEQWPIQWQMPFNPSKCEF